MNVCEYQPLFPEFFLFVDDEIVKCPWDTAISRDHFHWRVIELSLDVLGNLDSELL